MIVLCDIVIKFFFSNNEDSGTEVIVLWHCCGEWLDFDWWLLRLLSEDNDDNHFIGRSLNDMNPELKASVIVKLKARRFQEQLIMFLKWFAGAGEKYMCHNSLTFPSEFFHAVSISWNGDTSILTATKFFSAASLFRWMTIILMSCESIGKRWMTCIPDTTTLGEDLVSLFNVIVARCFLYFT